VPLIVLTLFLNSAGTQGEVAWFEDTIWPQNELLSRCTLLISNGLSSLTEQVESLETQNSLLANIVTGIGAGIYEELVFRLILICILMLLFQDILRFSHKKSIILSVLVAAALFSAHHHIDFLSGQPNANDPFNVTEFVFRTIAGVYFAALFAIRGFGITAGTHAFYNIIAVSITARFF
jgi:membrane protease YdiL (CAAX protease family)